MCYCGKNFDNSLEVAAHNAESHKDGYTCGYEGGGQDPYVTNLMMINQKCGDMCVHCAFKDVQ